MKRIVNFLFEAGMLKKTPRTGYQFLGTGKETVAEHSFRTTVIGYILSTFESGAEPLKTTLMCLFHDLAEARTGDHNYVNKKYVSVDEDRALKDLSEGLPCGNEIVALNHEFREGNSIEAAIANDADQLDLMMELKEQLDLGNNYAREWLEYAVRRLRTSTAKKMAREILATDSTEWWFEKKTDWWVNGPLKNHKPESEN